MVCAMKKPKLTLLFFALLFPLIATAQIDTVFKVFSATQTDEGVLISFTVRGGVTCSGVKIERSADGFAFEEIYEFAGVCGAIYTDESYTYTDTRPLINKTAWYRLDLGSLGIYSYPLSIKYIDYSSTGAVIFPHPCRNNCRIYFSNKSNYEHEVTLFDLSGRMLLAEVVTNEQWVIPAGDLQSGIYLYSISRNGLIVHTGKILIL